MFPLFFSCINSQEEEEFPAIEEMNAIGFNTKALYSRTSVSDVSDIKEFNVYAVMSEEPDEDFEQPSDVVYSHILSDENVYWSDEADGFTYNNTQYWVNQRTFHFFGYWPAETETEIDANGVSYNLTYSATETSARAEDDLLTFHYSEYVDADKAIFEAVPITFNRALTQVRFEMTQDFESNPYDEFCVTSVTFSGIKAGGTFTTSRFDKTGQWHFTEEKLSFKAEFTGTNQFRDDETPSKTLVVFDALNLVPQKIEKNTMAFVVNYTYQQGEEDRLVGEVEERKATIYLPISEWLPGMKYNYKMALYQNNLIVFKNINVTTWGEEPNAGTIIIK